MGDLSNHLKSVIERDLAPDDVALWGRINPLIDEKGLEAALHELPPTSTLEAAIVSHVTELIASKERDVINDVFTGKKTLRLTRLFPHLLKPSSGLPIVTTNYDRLIEIAAEEAGLGLDTMFVGHFSGTLNEKESRLSFCREVTLRGKQVTYHYRQRVALFKPHGSLDWYHREGKPVRYPGDIRIPRLVITPGVNKFRNGYESPFDRHRERANHAIDRASRFLIIGYGFNDDHLETHLTPHIRDGVPTLLLTRGLSSNAAKLAKECENVVAIFRSEENGKEGSSLFVDKEEIKIPNLSLWELETFISEVLEP